MLGRRARARRAGRAGAVQRLPCPRSDTLRARRRVSERDAPQRDAAPAATGSAGCAARCANRRRCCGRFLYFFCLLSGYYVLRPVRDAMGASSDVEAVFPPAMIDLFAARGIALGDFTLQVLFTCTFVACCCCSRCTAGWSAASRGACSCRWSTASSSPACWRSTSPSGSGMPGRGAGVLPLVSGVQPVRGVGVLELHGRHLQQRRGAPVLRLHRRRRHARRARRAAADHDSGRAHRRRQHDAGLGAFLLVLCIVCIVALRRVGALAREPSAAGAAARMPIGGSVLAGLKLVAREPLLRWLAVLMLLRRRRRHAALQRAARSSRKYYTDPTAPRTHVLRQHRPGGSTC